MNERRCRCEATIPPEVLEGFCCGNAECWREPVTRAAFGAFVTRLIEARGEPAPQPASPSPPTSR